MILTSLRRARRSIVVPAVAALVVGAAATSVGVLSAPRAAATEACPTLTAASTVFNYTGGEQCFTVPANVTTVHVVLVGGIGNDGYPGDGKNSSAGAGGHGAQVTADVTVVSGEVLYVEVGGNGVSSLNTNCSDAKRTALINATGWNGGAKGGSGDCTAVGGGGGGETDIRTVQAVNTTATCANGIAYASGGTSVDSRVLIAGGGGGGGNGTTFDNSTGGNGGTGGSTPASNQSGGTPQVGGGAGGTVGGSSAGGAGGTGATPFGGDGATGGVAQPCGGMGGSPGDNSVDSGGGGGGGYWGAGGGGGGPGTQITSGIQNTLTGAITVGGGGGGGAGSSFAKSGVTSGVSVVAGTTTANATVSFTTTTPTPTQSVQAITTPAVGSGGAGLNVGIGLLATGLVLIGALAFGMRRREPGREPRPPA